MKPIASSGNGARVRKRVLELERFLPYRLSVLSNTVSQAIAGLYERRFALSITEWRVMAVLGRYDDLSAREVAERTAMDKVAVSRALACLIAAGRVRRLVAEHDKRQSALRLTALGWKVYDEVAPLALEHERRLLAHLDLDEQRWLTRILEKLRHAELDHMHAPLRSRGAATSAAVARSEAHRQLCCKSRRSVADRGSR